MRATACAPDLSRTVTKFCYCRSFGATYGKNSSVSEAHFAMDLPRDQWTWSTFSDLSLHEFQALIIDYERKQVLLKRDGTRWIMPAYAGDNKRYESSYLPEFVKGKLLEELDTKMDMCVLRQVWRDTMRLNRNNFNFTLEKAVVLVHALSVEVLHDANNNDDSQKESGNQYLWVPLRDASIFHAIADARKVVGEEIRWAMQAAVPLRRLRWQCPGWMESTLNWMQDILDRTVGVRITQKVFVERSTDLGTVIIAETSDGKFFLKCTPPWQNDASYTEALSKISPNFVAAPIAVDVQKQVMITKDYGKILDPHFLKQSERIKMTQDFVNLQRDAVGRVDELVRAGMPDFRLDAFLAKIARVVEHPSFLGLFEYSEYREGVNFLQHNVDKISAKVRDLYGSGVPATVTHNDLWASNFYKHANDERFLFFDWVDSYVAHPLASELDGLEKRTYITEWEKYTGKTNLQELVILGREVCILVGCIVSILIVEAVEEAGRKQAVEEAGKSVNSVMECFAAI